MLILSNPVTTAAPALTEMYVRDESALFVKRYWDLILLTLSTSTLFATAIAAGNSSFISVWTQNRIAWPWEGDFILALLIVLRNLNGCYIGLFGLTKDWRPVRYILPLEGIVFIPLGIMFAKSFGIMGVLVAALLAHILVTSVLSTRAASKVLGSPRRIAKSLMVSLLLVTIASLLGWFGTNSSIDPMIMIMNTVGICLFSLILTRMAILPKHLWHEMTARIQFFFR
jgi:hypothetical protein